MSRRIVMIAVSVAVLWAATGSGSAADPAPPAGSSGLDGPVPIVFVHGFMGSGQQFEAQALRFASNGYPPELIDVLEYDSLAWPDIEDRVWADLDARIDGLLERSGAEQAVLVGHSQGTSVSQDYLNSDPDRAARVSAYVNLDGGAGGAVPDSIRTLAVWGEGDPGRHLPGATNVQFADQGHTEVVNSPETFTEIHRFVFGDAPTVDEVVRETGPVTISGRVLLFPENEGAHDATLEVYRVDATTGARQGPAVATLELTGEGRFGPLQVDPEANYEFSIVRDGEGTHHVYPQPFVRSSPWVRILSSDPDGLANSFWEPSDTSSNLTVLRNQEWWADQGDADDVLAINGRNVLDATNAPRSRRIIGVFVHDAGGDGISGSVEDPPPSGLPFLTGVDLVIPAGDPAIGTTSVRATPRLGEGDQTVCIPALSSADHRLSVQFNSYHRLLDAHGNPAAPPANPTCVASPEPSEPTGDAPDGSTHRPTADAAAPVSGDPAYTG